MKQETKETKKPKSFTQKAKKIRSMVMMTLLCVLMMSAATYAWFTLSNTAKASNLTMTVGDVTGLEVADLTDINATSGPSDSEWKSATTPIEFKGKLLPATTTDGINIYEPVYGDDGSVTGLSDSATTKKLNNKSVEGDEGYYVEYIFWIRAQGPDAGTTEVQLDIGTDTNGGIFSDSGSAAGTYSLSKNVTASDILPSAAVRISLDNGGAVKVFEPNADYDTAATKVAADSRSNTTAVASNVTQKVDGSFSSSDSKVFTLTNNTATKITLRIWLEGTDAQCGNEIAAKNIISQLKFSTVN